MSEIIAHPWMNKGFDRPLQNYLPKRNPLQLPIDAKVVNGMNGFGFGTVEQITKELESLVLSEEYQAAAKNLEALSLKPNNHHTFKLLKGKESLTYSMNESECISSVYHPIISVYYLVKERMERESINTLNVLKSKRPDDSTTLTSPNTLPSENSYCAGYSYTLDGKIKFNNPTEYEEAVVRKSIQLDEAPSKVSADRCSHQTKKSSGTQSTKPAETILHRLRRRVSRQLEDRISVTPDKVTISKQNFEESSPPYITVDDTHITASNSETPRGSSSIMVSKMNEKLDTKAGLKLNKFIKRAKSVTVKDLPSTRSSQVTDEYETPRRKSVFHSAVANKKDCERESSISKDGFLVPPPPSTLAPNGRERSHRDSSCGIPLQSLCQADQSIRSVYLKGLFSVSNTSTKKAHAIRDEIINVLDKRSDIQYRETKDRFECFITDSTIHHLKISDDFFDRSSDGDVWDKCIANSVRFDIFIVRIPWLLSIRGIQFRRISGDPWYYKDTCSRILRGLHL